MHKIENSTLDFLSQLSENNNRDWFAENRYLYDAALDNMRNFIGQLYSKWAEDDPNFANANPKKAMFRIYRDMRFSKSDKPYKEHFGAVLAPEGTKSQKASIYFQLNPKTSFLAAGVWQPNREVLSNIRQEIDYTEDQFDHIIKNLESKGWTLDVTNSLKRPPKEYDKNHVYIHYLKLKSFVVTKKLTDKEVFHTDFASNISSERELLKDFLDFINRVYG